MRMHCHHLSRIGSAILLYASCTLIAFAQPHHYKGELSSKKNAWFVGAGGGIYWAKLQDSSTNVSNGAPQPPPFNQDLYTINNPSANGVLQVSAGYRWKHNQLFIPYSSIYLQYRHYMSTNVTGNIYQYSLPEFLNYKYSFSYNADLFTLNGKLDLANFKKIMPYVSGGVGVIMNRLENYTENQTANVTPRISPAFNANTSSQFAATLGAGIDYTLTKNVWLTLGYEHVFQTNLPKASGSNTWAGSSLNLGSTRLDTVFLNISAKLPDTFRSNA